MFGYLNLNDPRDIADNEAQEANNCRVDGGKLRYEAWTTDQTRMRTVDLTTGGAVQTFYIDADFPQSGYIKRNKGAVTADSPGVPAPATLPAITAELYGATMYPPGDYQYAITIYDSVFDEESAPVIVDLNVPSGGYATNFVDWPALTGGIWTTKSPKYRIYRRPLGGTEFLEIGNSDVAPGTALSLDITPDALLDALCETTDEVPTGTYGFNTALIVFRERLFWSYLSTVNFSKAGQPGFTQPGFTLNFSGPVTSFEIKDESLYIFTEDRCYMLYGNDETDFVLRDLATKRGAVYFGTGVAGDLTLFGECVDQTLTILPSDTEVAQEMASVQALAGNSGQNISGNIADIFPLSVRLYDPAHTSVHQAFESFVLDNRFVVLKHAGKLASRTFATADALFAALENTEYLIYDQIGQGFLTGDSGSTFQYRTKEFKQTGKAVSQFRTGFVTGIGTYTVEVYGDGVLLTTLSYVDSVTTRHRFNVKPNRCQTFSFRFTGNSDATIYEYGRLA